MTVSRTRRRQDSRLQLEALIDEQGLWGQRLPSERELEAALGVCRTTVRRVLAELEREGVLQRRHGAGTFVAERAPGAARVRTLHVAVVGHRRYQELPGWDFRKEILRGLQGHAPRSGMDLTVLALDQEEDRARVWSAAAMRGFDAFVSMGVDDPHLMSHLIGLNRGPVVLLDGYVRGLPLIHVEDHGFAGMQMVMRHLLALGHRRIAFLDCHNRAVNNPEKFAGYCAALREKVIPFDEALVAVPPEPEAYYEGEAVPAYDRHPFTEFAVEALLRLKHPPTAIVGFDDRRAWAALRALEKRGLRVGRDISVAGCGDQAIRRGITDRLTSARIFPRRMAQEALKALREPLRHGEGRMILVPPRLFIRQSTGHAMSPLIMGA